ncbi:hypothetical protein psyc5s11_32090 [Clostridium gelidum]|uniref:Uncharacterized protein n=1 Tax=Clostridium gelidum TaxID=704125 RepID=A0ABM7T845_9CLOT|nr:hypothetical protein [Clostridium gelidum]BCZ47142.1 hypothetical protein psyc5s11_32090 [Clostridium gelidum]
MIIKINEDKSINYKLNSKKSNTNNGPSFSETLNKVINKSTTPNTTNEKINPSDIKITTGNELIDKLPNKNKGDVLKAIAGSHGLNDIFDIDILGNPDEFINKDSTINMPKILRDYGSNVDSNELGDLSTAVNTLMSNGLISNADYFYTLRWIATKQQALKVKMISIKNESCISNLILAPKESESKLSKIF